MASVSFRALYEAWRCCRRRKAGTPQAQRYEARLLDNLVEVVQALSSGHWRPGPPVCFMVEKPKAREIHAAPFHDRVVHHFLVPRLERIWEPRFIHDLYSNRKGKGTHRAVARLRHFMRAQWNETGGRGGCYMQLDIHNFFNSIDRPLLFRILQRRLGKEVRRGRLDPSEAVLLRDLAHRLLRQEIGAEARVLPCRQAMARVPPHKRLINAPPGKGLPLGNLSSQFFANVYLDGLDQFVKHHLRCRRYLRYVDDFVLLHPCSDTLRHWREEIETFLANQLELRLKPGGPVRPLSDGVDFLGYIVRPHYLLVRRRVVGNLHHRLEGFRARLCRKGPGDRLTIVVDEGHREELRAVLASYLGHFRHASSHNLVRKVFHRHGWLHCLFRLHGRRLIPIWEPLSVTGYRSQARHFRRFFPNAVVAIQCGYRQERYSPRSPGTVFRPVSSAAGHEEEGRLWRACVRHLEVTEQGYLKGGLKRRVVRRIDLFLSPLSSTQPGGVQ